LNVCFERSRPIILDHFRCVFSIGTPPVSGLTEVQEGVIRLFQRSQFYFRGRLQVQRTRRGFTRYFDGRLLCNFLLEVHASQRGWQATGS
jgi:hypothetical protein